MVNHQSRSESGIDKHGRLTNIVHPELLGLKESGVPLSAVISKHANSSTKKLAGLTPHHHHHQSTLPEALGNGMGSALGNALNSAQHHAAAAHKGALATSLGKGMGPALGAAVPASHHHHAAHHSHHTSHVLSSSVPRGVGAHPTLTVIGSSTCPHTTAQRARMERAGIDYKFLDDKAGHVPRSVAPGYPTMVCRGDLRNAKMHTGEMPATMVKKWCSGVKTHH
eukprot:PhM_4_TR12362/c0_g1_i1/m.64851